MRGGGWEQSPPRFGARDDRYVRAGVRMGAGEARQLITATYTQGQRGWSVDGDVPLAHDESAAVALMGGEVFRWWWRRRGGGGEALLGRGRRLLSKGGRMNVRIGGGRWK